MNARPFPLVRAYLLVALAVLLPAPEPASAESVWLQVVEPAPGALREGQLDWVQVSGRASLDREPAAWDVALLIDVSASTAYASGADIDGDGEVGRERRRLESWRSPNPRHLSSDAGDTILRAEVRAVERLLETLGDGTTRFAVIPYAERARVALPLTSDVPRVTQALTEIGDTGPGGGTRLGVALEAAVAALEHDEPRRKAIVVLSDGLAMSPGHARREADSVREAAARAAERGIAIHTFAVGSESGEPVYAEVAAATGGRHVQVEVPGDLLVRLPRLRLSQTPEITIENRTAGLGARAVRVRLDGSFDGFAPLLPGENRLTVIATSPDGAARSEERIVHFKPRPARSAAESERFAAEAVAFQRHLEVRTLETELALEIESGGDQTPALELEVEGPRPDASRLD